MFTPSRNLPVLTLTMALLMSVLQWSGDFAFNTLVLDRSAIAGGEYWRLLTGHLVHTDWSHLFWNVLAFLVLGAWLEYHSLRLLLATALAGISAIALLLLSPWASIDFYCGLSGALNALMMVSFYLYWQRFPTLLTGAAFLVYVGKNVSEAMLGQAVLTSPAWDSYVPAHFVGALAGALLLIGIARYHFAQPGEARYGSISREWY